MPCATPSPPSPLVRRQKQVGYAGSLPLVNAESAYQQAVINLVAARANRLSDTVALFVALGGGWWHNGGAAPGGR